MIDQKRGTLVLGKKTILSLVGILLLTGLYFAWVYLKPAPSPRSVVMNYLEKKSGHMPWTAPETLQQAKEPWVELARQLQADNDYTAMYRHMGEYMVLGEKLLSTKEQEQQVTGLRIALEASRGANSAAEDPWLAGRICEAYLVPNLALCEPKAGLTRDQLISASINAFQFEEIDGQIAIYKRIIAAETALHQADWARKVCANLYSRKKMEKEALALLKEIQDPAAAGVVKKMGKLEKKLVKQAALAGTNAPTAAK